MDGEAEAVGESVLDRDRETDGVLSDIERLRSVPEGENETLLLCVGDLETVAVEQLVVGDKVGGEQEWLSESVAESVPDHSGDLVIEALRVLVCDTDLLLVEDIVPLLELVFELDWDMVREGTPVPVALDVRVPDRVCEGLPGDQVRVHVPLVLSDDALRLRVCTEALCVPVYELVPVRVRDSRSVDDRDPVIEPDLVGVAAMLDVKDRLEERLSDLVGDTVARDGDAEGVLLGLSDLVLVAVGVIVRESALGVFEVPVFELCDGVNNALSLAVRVRVMTLDSVAVGVLVDEHEITPVHVVVPDNDGLRLNVCENVRLELHETEWVREFA